MEIKVKKKVSGKISIVIRYIVIKVKLLKTELIYKTYSTQFCIY